MFENVQKLRKFLSVCEMPDPISSKDIEDAYNLLQATKEELKAYISELMKGKTFSCRIIMPAGDLQECGFDDSADLVTAVNNTEESIHLPFGSFSMNLWQELLKDKDNPVFQVLNYFEFNVRGIRNTLVMHGVPAKTAITCNLLNEHDIMDIFSLHSYENVYRDIFSYIQP